MSMDPPLLEAATVQHAVRPAPVAAEDRIVAIDALRGFALLGILVVNMATFSAPHQYDGLHWIRGEGRADELVTDLTRTLADCKFFTLFSLLFGLGMSIQGDRIAARGGRFVAIYARRLLALLMMGAAHVLLLWYGDVLVIYAVLGVPLALARRLPRWVILAAAMAALAVPLGFIGLSAVRHMTQRPDPEAAAARYEEWKYRQFDEIEQSRTNYTEGTFGDIVRQRLRDYADVMESTPNYFGPHVLAMFLLGLFVGRAGIVREPERFGRLYGVLLLVGLPLGLGLNLAYTILRELNGWPIHVASWVCFWAGVPLLSFGYAAVIVLVAQSAVGRRVVAPLAVVGRMALTNYLMQSVICTTIFYSYGLALFDEVGAAAGLLLAVAIFACQVPLSMFWLWLFRFGPLEWLWRCFTYWEFQPLLRRRRAGLPPPTQGILG